MATNVIMPALGVAQQTGTLLKWLKAEGQAVSKGEPLMEIETDKATVEIEAPGSGILAKVTASPGDQVPVGNRIAVILAPGEPAGASPESLHASPLPTGEGNLRSGAATAARRAAVVPPLPQGEGRGEGQLAVTKSQPTAEVAPTPESSRRLLASPAAKRIAREKGVDLASLKGRGPEGSILAEDVLRAAPGATAQFAAAREEKIQPLSPMRRIVAERMTHSKQSAPHFYLSIDIDMSAVTKRGAEWPANRQAQAPSLNDFILYACARALRDFPSLNSSFTEQGIRMHSDINLGMAVALEEGLVVPVIRNADRLSLGELTAQTRELVAKAQTKKLVPFDYEGGTFTVSNLGMLGVDNFIAIINPPQAAILALGRVAERIVAENGMFAIKPMMTATLSADHRAVDGAIGARFLQQLKRSLETESSTSTR
jgi:pyruvate dehydrogenase E2 component (dihydrolipoamide acetyltransferase)